MRNYLLIFLLSFFIRNIHAQTTNDINNAKYINDQAKNSIMEPKLEHYNFSDTLQNSFAKYLINSEYKRYHVRLNELNEESIENEIKNGKGKYLFRILSDPSFNHPILFSISSINERYFLHWKVGKGYGGYEPQGAKKRGNVKISQRDWEYFLRLIDITSIDTLPLVSYFPMQDGTSWVIEKNIGDKYKIHFTNDPLSKIIDVFALFSHISNIKNKDFFNFYGPYDPRFFNKDNIKIDLDSMRREVITHLNRNFYNKFSDKDYCFDCGLYLKINSKGRIKSVKYIPYILPHRSFEDRYEYFADNFQDRKFRHILKKSFKELDLSIFKVSGRIWVPVYIKYDKANNILELDKNN